MAEVQIKSVNWWHERFADWLLANPEKRLKDAAKEFGVQQAWLSVVKNSDVFKEFFHKRSEELSKGIISNIRDKTIAMTEIALDALNEKLALEADYMTVNQLMEVADTGLARLGYGASKQTLPPPVNINADKVLITREDLAVAREKVMEISGARVVNLEAPQKLLEKVG